MPTPATDIDLATAAELGQQLRVDPSGRAHRPGPGIPTSSMSAADLIGRAGEPRTCATTGTTRRPGVTTT